jgi:hypothetical protein
MARDFDKDIEGLQITLAAAKREMAAIADRFVHRAAEFLRGWYVAESANQVKNASEITFTIAKEDLAKLKREVESLADNALDVVRTEFNKASVWWHIDELAGESKDTSGLSNPYATYAAHQLPNILEKPLRYAMGRLAPLLEARGYLRAPDRSSQLLWRQHGTYPSGVPYYPYPLVAPPEPLYVIVKSYTEALQRAKAIISQLDALKREKAQSQAKDLWDSI